MTAIIDDPNHKHYGPIRRLWVILAGMFGNDVDKCDAMFQHEWAWPIWEYAENLLDIGATERTMMQEVVLKALIAHKGR